MEYSLFNKRFNLASQNLKCFQSARERLQGTVSQDGRIRCRSGDVFFRQNILCIPRLYYGIVMKVNKLFAVWSEALPHCPLCQSEKGYSFWVNQEWNGKHVQCKYCGAQWFLVDNEREKLAILEKVPSRGSHVANVQALLALEYPFDFWKKLNTQEVLPPTHVLAELMGRRFPKCPICRSQEGYESSPVYRQVFCISCGAEWYLDYRTNTMMALKEVRRVKRGVKFLNILLPIEFWKEFEPEGKELISFHVGYFGGHPQLEKAAEGTLVIFPQFLYYSSFSHDHFKIPLESFQSATLLAKDEIARDRVLVGFVLGAGVGGVLGALWKKTKHYVQIAFENEGLVASCLFTCVDDKRGMKARSLVDTLNARKKPETQEEKGLPDPFRILQIRYAKGEITDEEYQKMRKMLES